VKDIMHLLIQRAGLTGSLRLGRPGRNLPARHSRGAFYAALEQEQEKSLVWLMEKHLPR